MAIDTRIRKLGLDRNKYFKGNYVLNMKLVNDPIAQGVFYSNDVESLKVMPNINGSTMHTQYTVKISTNDYIPDLEVNDYVLYGGDGELWLVNEIVRTDYKDFAKQFRRSPTLTVISMRR